MMKDLKYFIEMEMWKSLSLSLQHSTRNPYFSLHQNLISFPWKISSTSNSSFMTNSKSQLNFISFFFVFNNSLEFFSRNCRNCILNHNWCFHSYYFPSQFSSYFHSTNIFNEVYFSFVVCLFVWQSLWCL